MQDSVQIGMGREARRAYRLSDVSLVPTRRTRDVDDVSTAWQIDAFRFELPLVAHPSDATMSPGSAARLGEQGGLGVLNAEGLWTRYEDPEPVYAKIVAAEAAEATSLLQQAYAEPVREDLIAERIRQLRESGVTVAVRLSPQHTTALAPGVLKAGVDILVVQGTIVSAEHVTSAGGELNLKEFIADLDVPVIVGGCGNYQTALHLMRTGAAGVIVGSGHDALSTGDAVLGIRFPMATAIADAAAARRDYLDETGGRYVHVIADGEIDTSGDIAVALACGADAVMLGRPLARAGESPGQSAWWHTAASHPQLPRGTMQVAGSQAQHLPLAHLLHGPAHSADGTTNLFGGLRRAMAKCGYRDLKEFQRVGLLLGSVPVDEGLTR